MDFTDILSIGEGCHKFEHGVAYYWPGRRGGVTRVVPWAFLEPRTFFCGNLRSDAKFG